MMKSITLCLATVLFLEAAGAQSNVTIANTSTTVVPNSEAMCPFLLDYTYGTIYNDDLTMQGWDICQCAQDNGSSFRVDCDFIYCQGCHKGVCVGRQDAHYFESSQNSTTTTSSSSAGLKSYEEILTFLTPMPFETEAGESRNWTELRVEVTGEDGDCSVLAVDDELESSQLCTCELVQCAGQEQKKRAYNCSGGVQWGYCDESSNNMDPDSMEANNPLIALNPNIFSWNRCFDPQIGTDEEQDATVSRNDKDNFFEFNFQKTFTESVNKDNGNPDQPMIGFFSNTESGAMSVAGTPMIGALLAACVLFA